MTLIHYFSNVYNYISWFVHIPLAFLVGDALLKTIIVAGGGLEAKNGGTIGVSAALEIEPSSVGSFKDFSVIYGKSE